MPKPATTSVPILPILAERWSTLAFMPKPVDQAHVRALFEAARWAASSYNDQPWSFVIAGREQSAEFSRLLGLLMPANQIWAQHAGLLVLTVAKLIGTRTGQPNRHAYHDVGLATQNMVIQAQALGLACHQMGGFDQQRARDELQIPAGHDPVTAIAIGYPGTLADLDPSLHERQQGARTRKPLEQVVFRGTFGQPAL